MKQSLTLGIVMAAMALCQPFLCSLPIHAAEDSESAEIQSLLHQVDTLADVRQLDTAIVLGESALERSIRHFGDSDTTVARCFHLLGRCYYYVADYAVSESLWNKSLSIRENALGPGHPDVASSLCGLANIYKKQGNYTQAGQLFNRALEIRENALEPDHPDVAESLTHLAALYRDTGKYTEAEPLYKRAMDIYEKALGAEHADVARCLNSMGILYWKQGKYADAEPIYRRVLEINERTLGEDHPNLATSLNNLAILYRGQGKYAEAEPLYKRALEIKEKTLGPEHPGVAQSLNNLGLLYWNQGKYAEAEPLYKRALRIQENALGPEHPDVARCLNSLGILYWNQGRYTDAESLYMRALGIYENSLKPDHPDIAATLNNLAILYRDQAKYAEAEPFYRRALEIKEQALGPDHPDVAQTIHNLANLYRNQGRYEEAEPFYKRALEIQERAFGPEHPDVAQTLHDLANLYRNQGRYSEAETNYRQSLTSKKKALGPDHLSVATCLNNLAILYTDQGRYSEAEPLYRQALAIKEKTLGSGHAGVAQSLNNLGLLHWTLGRYSEAEPLYRRALDIQEKALGPDHPDVASSLTNLAILYRFQGKYTKAERLSDRILTIREKALGTDHPELAASLHFLANLYREQGKYSEAGHLHNRAIDIYETALGPDHAYVAFCLNDLGDLLREQGKYAEAEPLLKRALSISRETLGPDHPAVATTLDDLGNVYLNQGKYVEAESLFKQALPIREKALGSEHPDAARSLRNLAIVYASLGKDDKCLTYYRELQHSRQHFVDYVFSYASEDQKMRYVEKYPLLDHSFISFAIETNSDDSRNSVLEMILKGKAAVIDAISAEREFAYCSYDEGIQEKARRHAEICGDISTMTLVGVEELDPEIYRDRLGALYATKDSLEADLSATCAEFNEELTASRFTVTDVASALPEGALLWEFVRYEPYDFGKVGSDDERAGPSRYVVFTLDHTGNTTLTDLGDAGRIDSLVTLVRDLIYRAGSEVYSPLAAESEMRISLVAGRLYDIIFLPLEPSLEARTDIFISPDGQLSLLPFEIFPCPDGKYVIERFRISYLSSGRDLLKFRQRQEFGDWALAMADPDFNFSEQPSDRHRDETLSKSDVVSFSIEPFRGVSECFNIQFNPLPHSRVEARSVAETLKSKTHLRTESYFGADALEGVLKAMASAPRVLHLATHGYFCEDIDFTTHRLLENPLLRSGLALSGANRLANGAEKGAGRVDDGILTAFEVSGLNLNGTELVVLSACESGVGQVTNGEGVYGLRRAFQCAGARTVVMSLWKVPDKETGDMMGTFYNKWLSGLTKKEALRQSALDVLNACRARDGTAHPLFWGGFVLVGQPD